MSMTPQERQSLFLELAHAPEGVTAQEVYEEAVKRGDSVSAEAYFNLGRRLAHRGMLKADKSGTRTSYIAKVDADATWLDEEHLASIIDPEYPLPALTAYRESLRQIRNIPDAVWAAAREKLSTLDARDVFIEAIISYADNLKCEIDDYARERKDAANSPYLAKMRRTAERSLEVLTGLCKRGLGLSMEAVSLPVNIDVAVEILSEGNGQPSYYNEDTMREELARRIEPGALIQAVKDIEEAEDMVIGGVDGSSMGGLLSIDGAGGDFSFGRAPQLSINTATGVLNRAIRRGERFDPAFLRLPEKPEDMQQRDNRYTIMAKMFYPDLSDSEYVHSTWNAMDLLECRATLGLMSSWSMLPSNAELPACDVIFRDGTIVPHDRDSNHYGQQNAYGRIVRELIETSWKIIKNCGEDSQTVVGVVKNAQMHVFAPVINYILCQHAANAEAVGGIGAWPIDDMNHLPDQAILSRILTAGRGKNDGWVRTAIILRPFHATTDFCKSYSRKEGSTPYDRMVARSKAAKEKPAVEMTEEDVWWKTLRVSGDPYLQLLKNAWYAGFYLGTFPRLDAGEALSRFEFVLPHPTEETGQYPADACNAHLGRALAAAKDVGFDVDNDHSMFDNAGKIDIQPAILIRAHETVKTWARELRDRVSEYMDWHLAKYLKDGEKKKLRLRPWTRRDLEAWVDTMITDRRKDGGK